ncbi:MAG: UDP-N-acetylglucosamine diphosphorylase/glucosamine-1-phosphate N-acetyltransferase, partial [Betaproteobacteria bacterium]|nr:UDP-N-acetylglucosamine diphosphorylase/glucosamine-1-phosphate N-acetyltransferase [Betaproteobacteria bacterium]
LAAGQGKRMHSDLPKVLHALAGRSLLGHVLDTARALRPQRICVVHGHGAERVRAAFEADHATGAEQQPTPQLPLQWALQSPQLGTGHAVQQALPQLDAAAPTLVLYGDVPLTRLETLQRLIEASRQQGGSLAVLTVVLDDPTGYGRIERAQASSPSGSAAAGGILRIVEHKDANAAQRAIREVNTGIMVVPANRLPGWLSRLSNANAQQEYYLTDLVALAVADGVPVCSASPADDWEVLGVNSRLQLAELERVHQRNVALQLLEQGVALADPARLDVRGSLHCGRDVSIDINAVFEGEVVLADGVSIGPNCVLRNVRIGAGTRVEAFSHLDQAEIGARCRIGPYARIRPATQLADEVHIGNFVEVKASDIGIGSKANHLAYVGDSTVGTRVNIGAGTIT